MLSNVPNPMFNLITENTYIRFHNAVDRYFFYTTLLIIYMPHVPELWGCVIQP